MTDIIVTDPAPVGVLREVRVYCASAGNNQGQFPQHVYVVNVEDEAGNRVWSNSDDPAAMESGSTDKGFHKCLLAWLGNWRNCILDRLGTWLKHTGTTGSATTEELTAPRRLVVIAPEGDRTFSAYRLPPAELVQQRLKKADGRLYANAAWIAQVLAEAEEQGITIVCRAPCSVAETASLELAQNEAKRRWKVASREQRAQFA